MGKNMEKEMRTFKNAYDASFFYMNSLSCGIFVFISGN